MLRGITGPENKAVRFLRWNLKLLDLVKVQHIEIKKESFPDLQRPEPPSLAEILSGDELPTARWARLLRHSRCVDGGRGGV